MYKKTDSERKKERKGKREERKEEGTCTMVGPRRKEISLSVYNIQYTVHITVYTGVSYRVEERRKSENEGR